jgi:hypothetical protein
MVFATQLPLDFGFVEHNLGSPRMDDLDTVARVDVVLIRQDGFLGVRTHRISTN